MQTATALNNTGSTQAFNVEGTFTPGAHTVSIDFLNDLYGGSPSADRNLYVKSASIDGAPIPNGSLSLWSSGTQSLAFQPAANADTLTLHVSEDAWQGDAAFTVSMDGQRVGGVYTATASHASGVDKLLTLTGNWGSGSHTLGVTFVNDAYGGTPSTDRNLYVNSVNYDGVGATGAARTLLSNGTVGIAIPALPQPGILTLHLSETAYQGNAAFTVAVDGQQLGGAQSVTARTALGGSQAFSFRDIFGAGGHDIAISLANGTGTSTGPGRSVSVQGVDYNGLPLSNNEWAGSITGTTHFSLVV